MKRMKKLISIGSVTALTLVLLIVFVSALAAAKPTSVSGSGSWTATAPTPWKSPELSPTTLTIGGVNYTGPYAAYLFGLSGPNDEGVYKATADQYFGGAGCPHDIFARNCKVLLEPTGTTGSYTLKVMSKSVSGSVSGVPIAGGRLNVEGNVINFPPVQDPEQKATANFQVSGSISYQESP